MSWSLLPLFGFALIAVANARIPLRQYFYVDKYMSWCDARSYCQQQYTDLAVFCNLEEIALAVRPAGFSRIYAWIGLFDEPMDWKGNLTNAANSWKWSATGRGSTTGFQNFSADEPNYLNAEDRCILLLIGGNWSDAFCSDLNHFVCFTETSNGPNYMYVAYSMSWSNALSYCRQYYTDLAVIEDQATNTQISNLMTIDRNVWIGLHRQPWAWVSGTTPTLNKWQGGAPQVTGHQRCVVEDNLHEWKPVRCFNLNPFVCHKVSTRQNFVTVKIQGHVDVAEPLVTSQVLRQLEEVLRAKSYTGFKIKWSIAPKKMTKDGAGNIDPC